MNILKKVSAMLIVLGIMSLPVIIFGAQDGGKIANPISSKTFAEFVTKILNAVIQIGYVAIVFFIVYAGFLFVSARGNEEQLKKAKTAFLWTIVGSAIILGAFVLQKAIENTIKEISK
jgi:hypothetical protein